MVGRTGPSDFSTYARRLIFAWDAARQLRIAPQLMNRYVQQGLLDGFLVPNSNFLYLDPDQVEALRTGNRPALLDSFPRPIVPDVTPADVVGGAADVVSDGDGAGRTSSRKRVQESETAARLEEYEQRLEQLQSERAELEGSRAKLSVERNRLANDLEGAQAELALERNRLSDEIEALKRDNKGLTTALEYAKVELSEKDARLKAAEAERKELHAMLGATRSALEDSQQLAAQNNTDEAAHLRAALHGKQTLESELLRLRLRVKRLAEVEAARDASIEKLNEVLADKAAAEAELNQLREQASAFAELRATPREVAEFRSRAEQLVQVEAVRDKLTARLAAADAEKSALRAELARLQERLDELNNVVAERDRLLKMLEKKEQLEAEVPQLRAQIKMFNGLEKERDVLSDRLDAALKEKQQIQAEVPQLRAQVEMFNGVEKERDLLSDRLDAALKEKQQIQAEFQQLQDELEELANMEAERNLLAAKVETVQIKERVFDAEVRRIKAHTALLETELKRYRTDEKNRTRRRR